jgi:hypothetical protein
MLNTVTVEPMAMASVVMTTIVNAGFRRRSRVPWNTSRAKSSRTDMKSQ